MKRLLVIFWLALFGSFLNVYSLDEYVVKSSVLLEKYQNALSILKRDKRKELEEAKKIAQAKAEAERKEQEVKQIERRKRREEREKRAKERQKVREYIK